MRSIRLVVAVVLALTVAMPFAAGATWVEESPARRAMLVALLRAGDYDRLESELIGYQSRFETGELSEGAVTNDYFAFRNSDAALEPKLIAWQSAMPKSSAAALATGMYYVRLGWLARGGAPGSETSLIQFRRMEHYFRLADANLRRALQINDRLALAYANLGVIRMAVSDKVEMRRILDAGLAKAPSSKAIHQTILMSLEPRWYGRERWPGLKLRSHLLGHQLQFGSNPELRPLLGHLDVQLGLARWTRGDYAGAVAAFSDALAHGDLGQTLYYRGEMLYRLNRLDEAMADEKKAACLIANAGEAYEVMGQIRRRAGDFIGGLDYLDEAVRLDPRNPKILMSRANLVLFDERKNVDQRYAAALADLDAALEFGDSDPQLFSQRRLLFQDSGRFPEALKEAERALRLRPNDSKTWMGYTEALVFGRDCRAFEAYATFEKLCIEQGTCADADGRMFPRLMQWMRCGQPGSLPPLPPSSHEVYAPGTSAKP